MNALADITLTTLHDPVTDDLIVQIRITPEVTRSADEWKWRVTQAIVLALSKQEGAV